MKCQNCNHEIKQMSKVESAACSLVAFVLAMGAFALGMAIIKAVTA